MMTMILTHVRCREEEVTQTRELPDFEADGCSGSYIVAHGFLDEDGCLDRVIGIDPVYFRSCCGIRLCDGVDRTAQENGAEEQRQDPRHVRFQFGVKTWPNIE